MNAPATVYKHTTIAAIERTEGPGPWWIAHEYPERPADRWTVWCWTCEACMLHLTVAARVTSPDVVHTVVNLDGKRVDGLPLPDVLRQALAWRQVTGLSR